MRKAVLMLLLALVAAPAWAEWVKLSETVEFVSYIDPATIHKDGQFRKVLRMQDLKERNNYGAMSNRLLSEYDCKEGRSRRLSYSMHSEPMLGGKVILSGDDPRKWEDVAPGTVGGDVLELVCAK